MNDSRLKLIRDCQWEEVFLFWYKNEGENPHWIQLAKEKGYNSWADWRLNDHANKFECAKAQWGLYEIADAPAVVSDWFGGPFNTWIEKYYDGEKIKSFAQLAQRPDILNLNKIKSLIGSYPAESIITALELSDGHIMVIEGMHRCCALAAMAQQGLPYPEKLTFTIGKSQLNF